jgi:hypothetical protein
MINAIQVQSPENYRCGEYQQQVLDQFDLQRLEEKGADTVVYWYSTGDYCGAGNAFIRIKRKWHYHGCGHCSCYGPVDEFFPNEGRTLRQIWKGFSDDLKNEARSVYEEALKLEAK